MHSTYLRDLFHLPGSKIAQAFFFFFVITQDNLWAQGVGYIRRHQEFYDDKPIHYGFLVGMPVTRFSIRHNQEVMSADSIQRIFSPNVANIRMGFSINGFLSDRFDVRTTPSVSLYTRKLTYQMDPANRDLKRESTWIEVPLLLKYKSQRRVNTRMYLLAGFTFGLETNIKQKRNRNFDQLDTRNKDFSLDYGIGLEQFLEFSKFTPELRFSHGLVNMLSPDSGHPAMERLRTHTVTLYLHFE